MELVNILLNSTLIATLITALIKGIQYLIRNRRIKQTEKGLKDIATLYDLLNELSGYLQADRVYIFKTENGGGIPKPGSETTITIVNEIYTSIVGKSKDRWQKQQMDESLVNYVSKIIKDKNFTFATTTSDKGILKDSFATESACFHSAYHIKTLPSKVFYLGITWHVGKNKTDLKSIDRDVIRVSLGKIKQLIQ